MFAALLVAELPPILISYLLAVCDRLGHVSRLLENVTPPKREHPQRLPLLPPSDHLPSLLSHVCPWALIQQRSPIKA